jgi:hypothetical protein
METRVIETILDSLGPKSCAWIDIAKKANWGRLLDLLAAGIPENISL